MFCASLRKRPEWAKAVPVLLKKETRNWKESSLNTHDISMPISQVATIAAGGAFLRFLLLSPADLKQPDTRQRMELLFSHQGGRRCAIVFLLSTNGDEDGLTALGRLQIDMMESFISIPVLPLTSLDDLPTTLEVFHQKLLTPKPPQTRSPVSQSVALLQHCSLNGPLPQRDTHDLIKINNSFGDMIDKISTEQGQDILRDYAPEVADRVIQFWTSECDEELRGRPGRVCWE